MYFLGLDLRKAAPLAFVFAALACGGGIDGGAGGCGPEFDADKIAEDAKKGNNTKEGAAARAAAADAVIKTGEGYKKDGFAGAVEGFSGSDALPGSPKSEFARLARSLPPTEENRKLIEQAMGREAARSGPGRTTDLAGNGGYASVVTGADGQPKWQWNAYDGKHSAPKGFDKPYVPPAGSAPAAAPVAETAPASTTDPAMTPPAGYTGCWPKPPPVSKINLHLMGGNGNRRIVDSTPIVCSGSYCSAIGFAGRGCCPVRPEGDPMRTKCEAEVMGKNGPRWMFKGNGRIEKREDNPYLAWAYGIGWAGACSGISPVCNWIEVKNENALKELEAAKTASAAGAGGGGGGGGGGGSSGSGSPSGSSGSAPKSGDGTPLKASTDTAPGNSNLESLIPTIPEVAPATDTPPY